VIFALIESVNLGWRSSVVFGSLIIGLACLVAFVFIEANAKSPMLPLALFQSHSFTGANLLTFLLYSAMGIVFFLLPLNMIQVQGYSPTAAGAAVLPLILIMFFLSRWSGGLVAHYGARRPLIIGPLIVALGFGLLAVPSTGGSYWKEFFPALIVLGFGMTITVAPLTTVVMNSVSVDEAGAASGVNNAVARVAGVLAVAVFGIVIVKAFGLRLNFELAHSSLPPGILQSLLADQTKLAGLPVPEGINSATKVAIESAIRQAFIFGYRIVMLICAVLSSASSIVAGLMIPAASKRT
jgi:predicted MFS family arabinose efflux permease